MENYKLEQYQVSWHTKAEAREIIDFLTSHGYKNIQDLSPENYKFPIFTVNVNDKRGKLFFGSNATCMACHASCGRRSITFTDFKTMFPEG